MKKSLSRILFLTFVFTLVSQTIYSQDFPYQNYNPRTLSELVEIHSGIKKVELKGEKPLMVSAKPFYSAVRVEHTGKSREISKERMNLFKTWQKMFKFDEKVLTLLDKEYLFKQCDEEYWLPVQKQVASYFPKELKENDKITLYLMSVGGIKPKDDWEFVFFVNEFQKYEE